MDERSAGNGAWLAAIGDSPVLVQSTKVNKPGFAVTLLTPAMETSWTKTFEPEKGQYQPKLILSSAEMIVVVYESKKDEGNENYCNQ